MTARVPSGAAEGRAAQGFSPVAADRRSYGPAGWIGVAVPPRMPSEPLLTEMLADPLVQQLMQRDRISEPALRTLLDDARRRLDAVRTA